MYFNNKLYIFGFEHIFKIFNIYIIIINNLYSYLNNNV